MIFIYKHAVLGDNGGGGEGHSINCGMTRELTYMHT
jgi:hypothetical protein